MCLVEQFETQKKAYPLEGGLPPTFAVRQESGGPSNPQVRFSLQLSAFRESEKTNKRDCPLEGGGKAVDPTSHKCSSPCDTVLCRKARNPRVRFTLRYCVLRKSGLEGLLIFRDVRIPNTSFRL